MNFEDWTGSTNLPKQLEQILSPGDQLPGLQLVQVPVEPNPTPGTLKEAKKKRRKRISIQQRRLSLEWSDWFIYQESASPVADEQE